MKFFIDENLTPDLAKPLAGIYSRHTFTTAVREQLLSIDDEDLFRDLHARAFDAIITLDGRQLIVPGERNGLADGGLHWIGAPHVGSSGEHQLSLFTGVIAAGLHHVLEDWRETPHAYSLQIPGNFASMIPLVEPL